MHIPKKFFHDRIVLLLLTAMVFFTVLTVIMISLQLGGDRNEGFIIQYRPTLGLSAFQKGSSLQIASFALFAVLVCIFNTLLSMRVYTIRKHLAHVVLSMGLLLVILSLIISNSLLVLQ